MEDYRKRLADVIELDDGTCISSMITVRIVDVQPIQRYIKKDKTEGSMFQVAACDEETAIKMICYDMSKSTSIIPDTTLNIIDVIIRERKIILTSKTEVFKTSNLEVSPDIIAEAFKLNFQQGENKCDDILEAAGSPKKSIVTVKGTIYKVGPLEDKTLRANGEVVKFRKIKIMDDSSKIPVILWRKLAEITYRKKSLIRCVNFTVSDTFERQSQTVPSVTNKLSSATIEFLGEDDQFKIIDDNSSENEMTDYIILSVGSLEEYRCCAKPQCYNRKLKESRCPNCGLFYKGQAGKAYIAKLLVSTSGEVPRSYTVFTQQLQSLADKANIELNKDLDEALLTKLPMECNLKMAGTKIVKIL